MENLRLEKIRLGVYLKDISFVTESSKRRILRLLDKGWIQYPYDPNWVGGEEHEYYLLYTRVQDRLGDPIVQEYKIDKVLEFINHNRL